MNDQQVWCELHKGYVENWEAKFVAEGNIRAQRPAEHNTLAEGEYSACVDCLAEEIHPLDLEPMW